MSVTDALLLWALLVVFLWGVAYARRNAKWKVRADEFHADSEKRLKELEKHMLRFQNPDAIASDMEQVADVIEARQAGRQAMPRPGSEPHARVSRIVSARRKGWGRRG